MPVIQSRGLVRASPEETFAFFDDPGNLARIMPPGTGIRVMRVEPFPPRAGTKIEFGYGIGPLRRRWLIRYLEHIPGERIVDDTIAGPMRRFHHSHTFTPATNGGTWIEDRVDYHVGPDGVLGSLIDAAAGVAMRALFVWRKARQRRLLSAPSRSRRGDPPSGGTAPR
ncbi:MAG TPA: SRPBCC family protein [Candidatus Limnocylindria bacterium]|jgi:ligand-binding SRPBCC domain-containing protein